MRKCIVAIYIMIIIFIIMLLVMFLEVFSYKSEIAEKYQKIQQETEEIQCDEHEIVITSEYNFLLDKYKTISKCVKCGKKW